MRLWRFKDR